MDNTPDPKKVRGKIKSIGLSGFGPNSGELTLRIGPPGADGENYYAGIIDQGGASDSTEHGVFAAYVSIATLAYSMRATVECTYLEKDKARITGLIFP